MKVLLVTTMAPFERTPADEVAAALEPFLRAAGHEVEVMRIPFRAKPPEHIASQLLFVRGLELRGVERVIALAFPAFLIRHPRKTTWLVDGDGSPGPSQADEEAARIGLNAEAEALRESQHLFAATTESRRRLDRSYDIDPRVLRVPDTAAGWTSAVTRLLP